MAIDSDRSDGEPKPKKPPLSSLRFIFKTMIVLGATSWLIIWLAGVIWEDSTQNTYTRDLQTGNPEERRTAAGMLIATPRHGDVDKVVSALILALRDEDDEVRRTSVNSLGAVVRQLLDLWKNQPDELKEHKALVTAASRATMMLLKDRQDDVKTAALCALLSMHVSSLTTPSGQLPEATLAGDDPVELRTALTTSLTDKTFGVRVLAAQVLAHLGPLLSSEIPPELVAALEDESAQVREQAAWACDSYKEGLSPLLPDLFARLERAQPPLRSTLWQCLEGGIADPTLVPFLRKRLRSPSPEVRSAAAALLARMGPKAVAATPELLALLVDPFVPQEPNPPRFDRQPNPARSAAWALSKLPLTSQIIHGLVANLHSEVPDRRDDAAQFLRDMGPAARTSVPALITAFRERLNKDQTVHWIAQALASIAPGTEFVDASLAVLMEGLQSKNPNIRSETARALGQMGPQAKAAIPLLRRIAAEHGPIQQNARRALQAIEQASGK